MPEKKIIERARRAKREGKAPTTQAGEFVREEMEHIRKGKHGARSTKQAIAIGLSKARRAGVHLPPPPEGKTSLRTRAQALRDSRKGKAAARNKPSRKRSRAVLGALKREGSAAASREALAHQGRASARNRGQAGRQRAAKRAVQTKGRSGLEEAARKAVRTRRRRES